MLVLYFLGQYVEQRYGTREFIRFYLAALVFASVVWAAANHLFPPAFRVSSAGWARVAMVVPAIRGLGGDCRRRAVVCPQFSQANHLVHVRDPDAGLALRRYSRGLGHLGRDWAAPIRTSPTRPILAGRRSPCLFQPGLELWPHLPIGIRLAEEGARGLHSRSSSPRTARNPQVADEDVDRILEKIHREGEGSLTRKERGILQNASREYQRRRRPE